MPRIHPVLRRFLFLHGFRILHGGTIAEIWVVIDMSRHCARPRGLHHRPSLPHRPHRRGGSGDGGGGDSDPRHVHGSDRAPHTIRRSAPKLCYHSGTRHLRHTVHNLEDWKMAETGGIRLIRPLPTRVLTLMCVWEEVE